MQISASYIQNGFIPSNLAQNSTMIIGNQSSNQHKLPIPNPLPLPKLNNYSSSQYQMKSACKSKKISRCITPPNMMVNSPFTTHVPQDMNWNKSKQLIANMNFKCNQKGLNPYMTYFSNPNLNFNNCPNGYYNPQCNCCFKKSRVQFTPEEDQKIRELTAKYGNHQWSLIASFLVGRTPKQCRDRYSNYLVPGYFKGQWSNEEDELLKKLYTEIGPKWSALQKSFPDRSANSIKNRWNYFLCRQEKNKEESRFNNKNSELCDENDDKMKKLSMLSQVDEVHQFDDIFSTSLIPINEDNEKEPSPYFFDQENEIIEIVNNHDNLIGFGNDWTLLQSEL